MKTTVYLVCNSRGVDRITKKREPVMYAGEVAIKLSVSIPDSAFRSPLAEAVLEVQEEHLIVPPVVEVEVVGSGDDV